MQLLSREFNIQIHVRMPSAGICYLTVSQWGTAVKNSDDVEQENVYIIIDIFSPPRPGH